MKRKTSFKRKLFYFLSPLLILISVIIGYFIYGYTAYYRLEDNLPLTVTSPTDHPSILEKITPFPRLILDMEPILKTIASLWMAGNIQKLTIERLY